MKWLLWLVLPCAAGAQEWIDVDLETGWIRRDWSDCKAGGQWVVEGDRVRFSSAGATVLYWQVPTRGGAPLPVGRAQDWVARCDRPPLKFWKKVRAEDGGETLLLQVEEHRYVQWNWGVRGGVQPGAATPPMAELGFSVMRKGKDELRELVYSWHGQALEDSVWVSEDVIVPGFYTLKKAHIAVHTASEDSVWAPERRDLYADYVRAFPKETPGRIGRVYVKLPKGARGDARAVEFTHLRFLRVGTKVGPALEVEEE